jgi:hypothetical protein
MTGLLGSTILETAIGLVFVYLLVALVASVVNEWIAQITKLRSTTLEDGLRNMLRDPKGDLTLVNNLFASPWIKSVSPINKQGAKKGLAIPNDLPNYIPPRQFALALMDTVFPAGGASTSIDALRSLVRKIQNPDVETVLNRLIDEGNGDLTHIRQGLEQWFNDAMDRVGGWYQRKMRYITLGVGFVLVILLNADSVAIAQTLWVSPAVRATVDAAASDLVRNSVGQSPSANPVALDTGVSQINDAIGKLQSSRLPVFWSFASNDPQGLPTDGTRWFWKILGLVITTLAVSLGAPFWFDVLNKFMNFRGSGKPPDS